MLRRDLADVLPLVAALVIAKGNFVRFDRAVHVSNLNCVCRRDDAIPRASL